MSGRNWLESVEVELLRRRLPRQEVARLVAELADHVDDVMGGRSASRRTSDPRTAEITDPLFSLTEERTSMDASIADNLGSPTDIADTAVREFHRRQHLLSRSRLAAFCTFVLLPVPAVLLAWTVSLAALVLPFFVIGQFDTSDPVDPQEVTAGEMLIAHATFTLLLIAAPAGVAALFGRIARKSAHVWGWGLVSCLLVALGTAHGNVQLTFSESPGKSQLMFGLGFGQSLLQLKILGQFVIPLATGILVLRRSARYCSVYR